jgi:hypothetical protein
MKARGVRKKRLISPRRTFCTATDERLMRVFYQEFYGNQYSS